MKPITVINNTQYRAVQLTQEDPEADHFVNGWLQAELGHKVPTDLSEAKAQRFWVVRHPTGQTAFVSSIMFATDFQKVAGIEEPLASLEDLLKDSPTADDPFGFGPQTDDFWDQNLKVTPDLGDLPPEVLEQGQKAINDWMVPRVAGFLDWLENADDEESAAAEEAFMKARDKFMEFFNITEDK